MCVVSTLKPYVVNDHITVPSYTRNFTKVSNLEASKHLEAHSNVPDQRLNEFDKQNRLKKSSNYRVHDGHMVKRR